MSILRANPKLLERVLPIYGDRWLYLILLLAFALRTYHLAYPPWDYDNWRQTITLMVARDFAQHGFHLLHPQVLWVSHDRPSDPSYFSAEFSIQSVVAAILYKLFGDSGAVARLVVIAFSLLGIYFLYDLLNRRAGPLAARLGAFVYSLLPYHLFFGRVFMPDVPALSLAVGGLDLLDRWTDDRKWRTLLPAAALTALAVLQKLTVIFVALPALYLFWAAYGRRFLLRREPYIFAAIAALPSLAWYTHAVGMARQSGFAIMQPELFGRRLELWFQPQFVREVFNALAAEAFSPLGLVLALVGLFWPARGRAAWLFRLWVAAAASLLILTPGVLPENHYYLSLLLPGGAALAGLALAALASYRNASFLLVPVLALFAAGAIYSALPLYQSDRSPWELGVLLDRLTAPEDLIVTETGGSPHVLYFAGRRGWMLVREYNLARVERLAQAGARYYADSFLADPGQRREFFRTLDARFQRLTPEDALWPIYDLTSSTGPLLEMPTEEIQNPYVVNFGGQIELRGISLRKLLARPASFEVTYYWKCLKEPAASFRIFVHITNAAGQIAYQQDHWPLYGRFPTSRWKAGDIVSERYVVALPDSLPKGRYQIRLGWYDPARGPRLPILTPGASDQEDRARVAEIEVPRARRYHWFRAD